MRIFLRLTCIAAYIYLIVFSVQFNIIPLIEYHGGWAFLGTNIAIFLTGFALTIAGLFTFPGKPKVQATPKPEIKTLRPHELTDAQREEVQQIADFLFSAVKDDSCSK